MRRPPPIREVMKYPVTGGLAALSIAVTLAWWGQWDIGPLTTDGPRMWREPWRFLTSVLPHLDVMHLAFNVYWLWVFGTLLEKEVGHLRYAATIVLLGAGSGAAEFAVLSGGVGLSGIGYGLFGMLWVLSKRDERFRDAIDANTIVVFVAWFFLCIALTVMGVWNVANIAHGAGALLGGMVGWVYSERQARPLAIGMLAGVLAVIGWAASIGRPVVNFSVAEELAK